MFLINDNYISCLTSNFAHSHIFDHEQSNGFQMAIKTKEVSVVLRPSVSDYLKDNV